MRRLKTIRSNIVNFLCILAFITAGVSPACAFISGKEGYIEICASDGSLKTIKVSEGSDLYNLLEMSNEDTDIKDNKKPEHFKKQDCQFCFSNSNISKSLLTTNTINSINNASFIAIGSGSIAFKSAKLSFFQSRAPPLFI